MTDAAQPSMCVRGLEPVSAAPGAWVGIFIVLAMRFWNMRVASWIFFSDSALSLAEAS
ncbi:hypothetical protein CHELA40_10328 [Chelatococcus asaccharovorans]|nr:hypothetical protein CHELA40_10328 [Chelatococcus asaccharovorans]CAH1686803.1 hypothetical protein CHELA17_65280 [Chelatococcus asaccharovorans]